MYPELLKIGPISIKAWGLMMALSVVVALFISLRRADRLGIKREYVYDLIIVVVVSAIVGSRFFYVIFHLEEFRGNWLDTINPFAGPGGFGIAGLSMMGGVILVVVAVAVYALIKKINFPKLGDVIAPTFLLGAGITRIGCFLNGCCFGRPTSGACGVNFPKGAAGSFLQQYITNHPHEHISGLLPTQLFASAAGFILFFLVLWLEKWRDFDGYTSWLVLGLYSIDRFVIDQFRTYEANQILGHLGPLTFTVNEVVLLILFVFSVVMFILGKRGYRLKKKNASSS